MIVLIFKILGFIGLWISVIVLFFNPPLGIFFMLLASLLAVVGMTIGEGNTINLSYPIMEWIWSVGKYVLVIFAIMMVFAVVLELIKKIKSNKRVNKGMDIKNKGEQNPKILIIDNTMEDLLALKRESFIVEEVKIIKKYKYTPETKEELQALVDNEAIHLGDIDTSKITDMSYLFKRTKRKNFSGIETWNTINVKNMEGMFWGCENFNQDISAWNTSSVENMSCMFLGCENFNQPLNGWDVRNVEYRYGMFYESGMERDDSKKPRFEKE